jgi:hypothetical protein
MLMHKTLSQMTASPPPAPDDVMGVAAPYQKRRIAARAEAACNEQKGFNHDGTESKVDTPG